VQEIKAIIADDEDQLRSYLKSRLSEVWPELVICGEARNGQEALESFRDGSSKEDCGVQLGCFYYRL
jgi:YesN/AraC family two-component response regulator